jgi:hypothetical protein
MEFICSKAHPWHKGGPTPVVHPDAREVGEQEDGYPGGDMVTYECPTCGHRWTNELPQ